MIDDGLHTIKNFSNIVVHNNRNFRVMITTSAFPVLLNLVQPLLLSMECKRPFFCSTRGDTQNKKQDFFGEFFPNVILPKVPVFTWKKMALRVPEQKKRDHFLMPTSPQNGVEHVCFMRFALLGGI